MNHLLPQRPNGRSVPTQAHCTGRKHPGLSTAFPKAQRPHGLSSGQPKQRGVALIVALILLIVIALVALAAMNGTIMQQKMASNFYDRQIAFQATEGALRQAEIAVQAAASPAAFRDCTPTGGNHCLANPFTDPSPSPALNIVTVLPAAFQTSTLSAAPPQYVIEYLGNFSIPPPKVTPLSGCSGYGACGQTTTADFYRITARSGDPLDNRNLNRATVTLQSFYRH